MNLSVFLVIFFLDFMSERPKRQKDLIYSQRKVDFLGAKIQIGIKVISFRT